MEKSLFDFQNYKLYLTFVVEQRARLGRGFRSELSASAGVQLAFLYQVLKRDAHFNLEHGQRINQFLGHTPEESHYFLLLIQHARAGTPELQRYFRDQMKVVLNQRLILKNRIENERSLSFEDEARYYNSWHLQAIRCAVAIPTLRTRDALARKFGLSPRKVKVALEFLAEKGLIEKKGDQYLPTTRHLHLANDSGMRVRTHTNWRIRTLTSLEEEKARDLHYSAVLTLSEDDAIVIKAMLIDSIEKVISRVRASKEESVYTLCMDFFEL